MTTRIYRSRTERKIAGVCGGIAEYFDLDPSLIRILFVLLIFFNGFGIIAYLICWIVLPEAPLEALSTHSSYELSEQQAFAAEQPPRPVASRWLTGLGVILIALGFAVLVERFVPWFELVDIIPYMLIVAGIILLYRGWSQHRRQREGSPLGIHGHAEE